MRRIVFIGIAALLILAAGCTSDLERTEEETQEQQQEQTANGPSGLDDEYYQTLSDWVRGTDYGITDIQTDTGAKQLIITISEEKQNQLEDYEYDDIAESLTDILEHYGADASEYELVWPDGQTAQTAAEEKTQSEGNEEQTPSANEDTVNLIFIHHSVGENWLNDALCAMLNENGYHVADTYYGWDEMGDRTDTADWPDWFNDSVMPKVYAKMSTETANNTIDPGEGENRIIMFKSCFPNSNVGVSINDEKQIYNSLLEYFSTHPDKMFVLVTPPPMQRISTPKKTRELTNWLVSEDGWLSGYGAGNVFVFDLYNVLTAPDNHHYLVDGEESHIVADGSNELYYDSDGDDHPSVEGNIKAAEEFVPLLNYWYGQFTGR